MSNLDNYQFVTGIHGNERIPVVVLAEECVTQIVANPEALAVNKRFIEKDMNASFGTKGGSLEEVRAREIINRLDNRVVVDIHTTVSVKEPFVIVVDKKMIPFAKTLGIQKVVYMKYNIKGGNSLIDQRDGVSIECGIHDSREAYVTCKRVVDRLRSNIKSKEHVDVYEVFDTITKEGIYHNFQMHKDGFIPIFANKNSYGIYGLAARIVI